MSNDYISDPMHGGKVYKNLQPDRYFELLTKELLNQYKSIVHLSRANPNYYKVSDWIQHKLDSEYRKISLTDLDEPTFLKSYGIYIDSFSDQFGRFDISIELPEQLLVDILLGFK